MSAVQKADDVFNYATSSELGQSSGNYYVDGHLEPHAQPPIAQNPDARKRLWKLMQQQTGAQYPAT